jgi:hypothetical protein
MDQAASDLARSFGYRRFVGGSAFCDRAGDYQTVRRGVGSSKFDRTTHDFGQFGGGVVFLSSA